MSVLSIDYSRGLATGCFVADDFTYQITKLPIQVLPVNYWNKPVQKDAFLELLSQFEGALKAKFSNKTEVYVASLSIPEFDIPRITFCTKDDAFKSLYPLDFMYYSHLHVGDGTGVFEGKVDFAKLVEEVFFDEKIETITNYFENLKLYPQLFAGSDRDIYEEMAYLKTIARSSCSLNKEQRFSDIRNVIFSTTRELIDERMLARFMLLCVESMCPEGFYNFKLDHTNFLGATAALSFLNNKVYEKLKFPDFMPLGSIVNIADDVTCVFTTPQGTTQKTVIPKNDVFTFPIQSFEHVTLTLTTRRHGTIEKNLAGGVFGVVIDTREKVLNKHLTLDQKKSITKEWEDSLIVGMKNL